MGEMKKMDAYGHSRKLGIAEAYLIYILALAEHPGFDLAGRLLEIAEQAREALDRTRGEGE